MDLEYWIDYVHLFNVGHKIPIYDHMSFFMYHNMDIWLIVAALLYVVYLIVKKLLGCLWRVVCGSK